jgi:hypothetical protein
MRQKGFGVIEVIVVILLVAAIIIGGWWVWSNQNIATNSTVTTDPAIPVDETESWTTYCATDDSVCFKYPGEWTAKEDPNHPSPYKSLAVTSPDQKITMFYNTDVDGIGGQCDPGACLLKTTSIASLSGPNLDNIKLVKGVFTNTSIESVKPVMFLISDNKIDFYNLEVDKQVDVGFFLDTFSNPKHPEKESWFRATTNSDLTFTDQTSLDWFNTEDVVTAEKILNTTRLK